MPISINVNIDKIDKSKFFQGKKGRYLDLVLFETPESKYGDYLVKQQATKGENMPILGNGKTFKLKEDEKASSTSGEDNALTRAQKDPW